MRRWPLPPKRRALRRLSALLAAAALLTAGAGELAGLDVCEHHALPRPASSHGADAAGGAAHAGHHAEADVAPAGDESDHDAGHSGPCTCIGSCHGSAASPVPAPAPDVLGATHATAASASADRPAGLLLSYLLPFANAPPLHG